MTDEPKEAKFKRLAEKRVNVVLNGIRILGNLSNTALYNYSGSEVNQIFDAIDNAIKNTKANFHRKGKREKEKFSFN